MNTLTRDQLWSRLSEAGLVSGDLPLPAESRSPWPIRAMLGIAGWIGAIFLLGFAGVAFASIFRSAEAALPAGIVCCLAAYAIFRAPPRNNDFVDQFGFAVSLAGQALLLTGLLELIGDHKSSVPFLIMAATLAALALAIPNYVHRAFTTVAANFCLLIAAHIAALPALATVVAAVAACLIWLDPVRIAKRPSLWEPLGCGFAIALLHLDGSLMIGPDFWRLLLPRSAQAPHFLLWAGPLIAGLVFVYTVWQLRQRAGVAPTSPAGIFTVAAAVILALCGLAAPGITAAVLILTLGFANGDRVLMGLGLLAFAGYLSHFYYQLSATLLVKSAVLVATGAALLTLRWAMDRFLLEEESPNA